MKATMGLFVFVILICSKAALCANVKAFGTTKAYVHEEATFSCTLPETAGVLQVTWQKTYKDDRTAENLATHSEKYGTTILPSYSTRVNLSDADLRTTRITLRNVTLEDEACYICSFNAYPNGSIRGQICLTVYSKPEIRAEQREISSSAVSEKKVMFMCSATGKPAPEIRWNVTESLAKLAAQQSVENADKTLTATSNLTLELSQLQDGYVDCVVSTPGQTEQIHKRIYYEKERIPEPPKGHSFEVMGIVIAVVLITTVAVILVMRKAKRTGPCMELASNGRQWIGARCPFFICATEAGSQQPVAGDQIL
ncbi:OX-2 membrane glycoprotein-like isoform X1 [Lepisosteus oculatus]|uniref:OX-2 membrane glycoprotein-like isoform X1 n=1 Tax=Lepisosteus oculatus TaxID=7918 RepID=UPI0035F51FF7